MGSVSWQGWRGALLHVTSAGVTHSAALCCQLGWAGRPTKSLLIYLMPRGSSTWPLPGATLGFLRAWWSQGGRTSYMVTGFPQRQRGSWWASLRLGPELAHVLPTESSHKASPESREAKWIPPLHGWSNTSIQRGKKRMAAISGYQLPYPYNHLTQRARAHFLTLDKPRV